MICRDLESQRRFYRDVLGLPVLRSGSRTTDLDLGSTVLKLHGPLAGDEQRLYGLDQPQAGAGGLIVSLSVARLEPVLERVNGPHPSGLLVSGPMKTFWGDRIAILKDPDGNYVELSEAGTGSRRG